MSSQPHPFELVFGEMAPERFPAIRDAVGVAPLFDAFLMAEPAVTLMQELRPDEGLDHGGGDFLAFIFAAYRYWAAGEVTRTLSPEATAALVEGGLEDAPTPAAARYIQVAPRVIWGGLGQSEHFEPLDGWFAIPDPNGLLVVALFGIHPNRPGVSLVSVTGAAPKFPAPRDDGSAPFAPTMDGGDRAGLSAVVSLEELLLLAWRGSLDEGSD